MSRFDKHFRSRGAAFCLTLVAGLSGLAGCKADPDVPDVAADSGFGSVALALTGNFPGAVRMRVRLYAGPVLDVARKADHVLAGCAPYSSKNNQLKVERLEVREDYAFLIDLFSDETCTTLKYRAYRGGIRVVPASGTASTLRPYYVQPYEMGRFSSLALVNASLDEKATGKACSSETDCKSIHPNASCNHKLTHCTVDHLFPLNGQGRRSFPVVLSLDDGRIAVAGGLTLSSLGLWRSTIDVLEIFDPPTGIFRAQAVTESGTPVGLAEAVTLPNAGIAIVAGSSAAKVALEPGKSLSTVLDPSGCAGAGSNCTVSSNVRRWDLKNPKEGAGQSLSLGSPAAFPIVARVRTKDGDRVLVAGGAQMPLLAAGDARKGSSVLCKMDATGLDCATAGPTMPAGRARAATGCVTYDGGGCVQLLVLGGRKKATSALAEIYNAATNTFLPVAAKGAVPQIVHGGQLVPVADKTFLLLGASAKALFLEDGEVTTGGDLAPLLVQVDVSGEPSMTLTAANLGAFAGKDGGKRLLATAVGLGNGSVLLVGGLGPDLLPIADALLFDKSGTAIDRIPLSLGRFGAAAARISGKGPVGGCVLLAGGFAMVPATPPQAAPTLQPQSHVEVFCPLVP